MALYIEYLLYGFLLPLVYFYLDVRRTIRSPLSSLISEKNSLKAAAGCVAFLLALYFCIVQNNPIFDYIVLPPVVALLIWSLGLNSVAHQNSIIFLFSSFIANSVLLLLIDVLHVPLEGFLLAAFIVAVSLLSRNFLSFALGIGNKNSLPLR
jgi:hypothetical protein